MSKITVTYEKDLRTHCLHDNSSDLITDGPKELGGHAECFSPTDLFATSLASCMLTLMAVSAQKLHLDLQNTKATVTKEMTTTPPRRIKSLTVLIHSPLNPTPEARKILEDAALNCPVHLALHPDIIQSTEFFWNTI